MIKDIYSNSNFYGTELNNWLDFHES